MAAAPLTVRLSSAAAGGTSRGRTDKVLIQARARLICLVLLALLGSGTYDPARAEAKVEISLSGNLTESQRQNIRSHLSLARLAEDEPLSPALFHRLYGKIAKETALALEPFGYYTPDIKISQQQQNHQWQVNLVVATGPPVLITRVEIGLDGPGKEDPTLQQAVQRFPLQTKDVLDHQRYEKAKEQLITTALEGGYLTAKFRHNRVEIRRQLQTASMELHLDTGPRYTFGPITFVTDAIDHQLLHRIVPVREGDPFSPRALARLRQSLFSADYFTAVDLDYNIDQAAAARVPVRVLLTPSLAHKYGIGLGYGTDTGPRGTLEYTNRYINHLGHQLDLQLQPSQRKSNFGGVYTIPIGDPKRERLSLLGKYEIEQFDSTDSKSWTATVSRDHFREQGEYSTYLQVLDEQFSTGADNGHAALLIPGVKGSLFWADSRLVTTRGLRLSASLSGSEQGLLADTSFLQSTVRLKGIYTLLEQWRLIGRADLGTTLTDDIDALPPSLRFFAGGDQSVRGYGYKKIGPADAGGNIVGGKNLLTSSLELERTLFDQWSGAIFYDSGTATNSFADLHLQAAAGVGVRWNAPFGQIRLDLAKSLEDDGNSWRIHFTMGADL